MLAWWVANRVRRTSRLWALFRPFWTLLCLRINSCDLGEWIATLNPTDILSIEFGLYHWVYRVNIRARIVVVFLNRVRIVFQSHLVSLLASKLSATPLTLKYGSRPCTACLFRHFDFYKWHWLPICRNLSVYLSIWLRQVYDCACSDRHE